MSAAVVFVDTETTSLNRHTREIWEVGMIRHEDGQRAELQFFIDPVSLADADPASLKIGGYYERHPWGVKMSSTEITAEMFMEKYGYEPRLLSPALAAVKIAEWTHDAHLIGGVPSFDEESMAKLLRDHDQAPAWHYHLCDIENMMVGYLLGVERVSQLPGADAITDLGHLSDRWLSDVDLLPPWDSEKLAREIKCEITEADRHTALGDARWVERCWLQMYGSVAEVKD